MSASALPAAAVPVAVKEEEFDEAEYKDLCARYLLPRVREKDAETAGGTRLRRQTKPSMIDMQVRNERKEGKDRKGWTRLKKKIHSLKRRKKHGEIYRLLKQLRKWETTNNANLLPRFMRDDDDNDIQEVIDLTDDGPEAIDVDKYIIDVQLLDVIKPDPDAVPPVGGHNPTTGIQSETLDVEEQHEKPNHNLNTGGEEEKMKVETDDEEESGEEYEKMKAETDDEESELDDATRRLKKNDPNLTQLDLEPGGHNHTTGTGNDEPKPGELGPTSAGGQRNANIQAEEPQEEEQSGNATEGAGKSDGGDEMETDSNDEWFNEIIRRMKRNDSTLTHVLLSGRGIGDNGVKKIADALNVGNNNKLEVLWLDRSNISEKGAVDIANALQHSENKLRYLELKGNDIGPNGAKKIASALKHKNNNLKTLYFRNNNLGDEGAEAIANVLMHDNNKVRHLDLRGNNIGPNGAKKIADALQHENNKVKLLELYNNNLGDKGAEMIAIALMHDSNKVRLLDLGGNNVGPTGAKKIADALRHKNNKVIHLGLFNNNIGDEGAEMIANALVHDNNKLQYLNLGGNNIGPTGAKKIANALKHKNNKVEELYLRNNDIGDEGAEMLANVLMHDNNKVRYLLLDDNNIGATGAEKIANALKHKNSKVEQLYLNGLLMY